MAAVERSMELVVYELYHYVVRYNLIRNCLPSFRYYQDVKLMPAISDQDMNAMLTDESRLHQHEFNINAALYELYHYVVRYNDEVGRFDIFKY